MPGGRPWSPFPTGLLSRLAQAHSGKARAAKAKAKRRANRNGRRPGTRGQEARKTRRNARQEARRKRATAALGCTGALAASTRRRLTRKTDAAALHREAGAALRRLTSKTEAAGAASAKPAPCLGKRPRERREGQEEEQGASELRELLRDAALAGLQAKKQCREMLSAQQAVQAIVGGQERAALRAGKQAGAAAARARAAARDCGRVATAAEEGLNRELAPQQEARCEGEADDWLNDGAVEAGQTSGAQADGAQADRAAADTGARQLGAWDEGDRGVSLDDGGEAVTAPSAPPGSGGQAEAAEETQLRQRQRSAETEELAAREAARAAGAAASAAPLAVGDLVRVESQTVQPRRLCGDFGTVTALDPPSAGRSRDTATYTSVPTAQKKGGKMESITVGVEHLQKLPKAPPEEPKKRALTELPGATALQAREKWCNYHKRRLRRTTLDTELSQEEVDAGAFEVWWRLLPPDCVWLPSWLANLTNAAVSQGTCTAEEVQMQWQCRDLLERARCAVVPVWADGPPHWTLLAFERGPASWEAPRKEQPAAEADARAEPALTGLPGHCKACRNTRCAACDPELARALASRTERVQLLLNPEERPHLGGEPDWVLTYFDSLKQEHAGCREAAARLANWLGAQRPLPERENLDFQQAATCGFWCVHFAEEMCRRRMGLGKWTTRFDQAFRLTRLKEVRERMSL